MGLLAVGGASACVAAEPLGVTPATASPAPVSADGPARSDASRAPSNCQPWATAVDGPYRYSNNQWGHDKAKGPFKSPTIRRQGRISIHVLLQHLVASKLISPDEYVASVEFGNEVMGGTGTTWVRRFDLEVE
jgi:hypothetical protein